MTPYLFPASLAFVDFEPNKLFSESAEKKLLCALLARTIFDMENYLQLPPSKRNIYNFQIAKEAHNYIHSRAHYANYKAQPFSFEYVAEHVFNSANSIEALKIKRHYANLPHPTQQEPDYIPRAIRKYRSQLVRYS